MQGGKCGTRNTNNCLAVAMPNTIGVVVIIIQLSYGPVSDYERVYGIGLIPGIQLFACMPGSHRFIVFTNYSPGEGILRMDWH